MSSTYIKLPKNGNKNKEITIFYQHIISVSYDDEAHITTIITSNNTYDVVSNTSDYYETLVKKINDYHNSK